MHKRSLVLCAFLLMVALVASCGGGGGETNLPPSVGSAPGGAPAFDMSKANATVTGKISFEGAPPPNDKIQMSADPYCAQHAAQNPTTETVKVSDIRSVDNSGRDQPGKLPLHSTCLHDDDESTAESKKQRHDAA